MTAEEILHIADVTAYRLNIPPKEKEDAAQVGALAILEKPDHPPWVVARYAILEHRRTQHRHALGLSVYEYRCNKPPRHFREWSMPYEEGGASIQDMLGDEDHEIEDIDEKSWQDQAEQLLDKLPDARIRESVRLTIWFDWTLQEVADLFDITQSRVSQLRAEGLYWIKCQLTAKNPNLLQH